MGKSAQRRLYFVLLGLEDGSETTGLNQIEAVGVKWTEQTKLIN